MKTEVKKSLSGMDCIKRDCYMGGRELYPVGQEPGAIFLVTNFSVAKVVLHYIYLWQNQNLLGALGAR